MRRSARTSALGLAAAITVGALAALTPAGGGHGVPRAKASASTASAAVARFRRRYRGLLSDGIGQVEVLTISYVAHDGRLRPAYVVLPRWYGPRRHPAIPLVISPHGRGVPALRNVAAWGELPALGPFAVVNPAGEGRRLGLYSWGDPGQIRDLARMPQIVAAALPWLRIDPKRIYAVGTSMGGQETLLLAARYPRLLAGAAAFDAATDLAARYAAFPVLRRGRRLQQLARLEVGGTPQSRPAAYAARSPIAQARQLAASGVPLQIWWSTRDAIVVDQTTESGRLFRAIERAHPRAPVSQVVGAWAHSSEMRPTARLPEALWRFGLIQLDAPFPKALQ